MTQTGSKTIPTEKENGPKDKDLPLAKRDPATLTSEEIWELAFPELETDDNRDAFTELTADELVQMFGMMQGMTATKN